jgi:hypothetical protein
MSNIYTTIMTNTIILSTLRLRKAHLVNTYNRKIIKVDYLWYELPSHPLKNQMGLTHILQSEIPTMAGQLKAGAL